MPENVEPHHSIDNRKKIQEIKKLIGLFIQTAEGILSDFLKGKPKQAEDEDEYLEEYFDLYKKWRDAVCSFLDERNISRNEFGDTSKSFSSDAYLRILYHYGQMKAGQPTDFQLLSASPDDFIAWRTLEIRDTYDDGFLLLKDTIKEKTRLLKAIEKKQIFQIRLRQAREPLNTPESGNSSTSTQPSDLQKKSSATSKTKAKNARAVPQASKGHHKKKNGIRKSAKPKKKRKPSSEKLSTIQITAYIKDVFRRVKKKNPEQKIGTLIKMTAAQYTHEKGFHMTASRVKTAIYDKSHNEKNNEG